MFLTSAVERDYTTQHNTHNDTHDDDSHLEFTKQDNTQPPSSFFPTRARASTREFAIHPLHTAGRQTHFGRRGALVARRHTPSSKIPFVLPRLLTPTHHEWARSERATRRRTPAVTRKIRQQGSKSSG